MRQIKSQRLLPIQPKLMLVPPRGDMRMPAGLHIRIHADRDRRRRRAAPSLSPSLFQQRHEFRLGFDIEKQNPSRAIPRAGTIAKRLAHLLAGLSYTRKHNALAGYANPLQMLQLASGNNVEPAAQPGEIFQDREVAVGFHRKTQRMRLSPKPGSKLNVGIANRSPTVDVCGRTRAFRYLA